MNSDFGCCIKDFTEDNNAGDKDDGSNNTSIEPMSAMRKNKNIKLRIFEGIRQLSVKQ